MKENEKKLLSIDSPDFAEMKFESIQQLVENEIVQNVCISLNILPYFLKLF